MGRADVRAVQEMLSHADVGASKLYFHVESQRLMEEHLNFPHFPQDDV